MLITCGAHPHHCTTRGSHQTSVASMSTAAPYHPHRGFITVSYILSGENEHKDSMGNSGILRPGDVQFMTAGSGVIHVRCCSYCCSECRSSSCCCCCSAWWCRVGACRATLSILTPHP
jgi:hypothetical protein